MGAVVAGAIILVNKGAKARGALLRDVAALGLAVTTITAFLSAGRMSYARCSVLLAEYVAFVLIVLGADLWHIFTRWANAWQLVACADARSIITPLHAAQSRSMPPALLHRDFCLAAMLCAVVSYCERMASQ